jgi:hypothetical protein
MNHVGHEGSPASEAHTGATKAHLGVVEAHPGAVEAHPGVAEAHPGSQGGSDRSIDTHVGLSQEALSGAKKSPVFSVSERVKWRKFWPDRNVNAGSTTGS